MLTPKKPTMYTKYKNLSGDSKVVKFEIKKDAMTIRFADHRVYRYTNQSAGPAHISKMKTLALAGKGLGTYISAHVKDNYQRKVR